MSTPNACPDAFEVGGAAVRGIGGGVLIGVRQRGGAANSAAPIPAPVHTAATSRDIIMAHSLEQPVLERGDRKRFHRIFVLSLTADMT